MFHSAPRGLEVSLRNVLQNLLLVYLGDQKRLVIHAPSCKKIPEWVNEAAGGGAVFGEQIVREKYDLVVVGHYA